MIKRWLTLAIEFAAFILILCFLSFLYIEPHLESNFKKILEDKVGLKSNIGIFYFSPTGKIRGENIHLKGKLKNGLAIEIYTSKYEITPKDFIYELLLEKKENFSWKDLGYLINLTDVKVKFTDINTLINIEKIQLDLDKNKISGQLQKLFLINNFNNGHLRELTIDINNNHAELKVKDLIGNIDGNEFNLDDTSIKINAPVAKELFTKPTSEYFLSISSLFEEIRISSLKIPKHSFNLEGARLIKIDNNSWNLYTKFSKNNQSYLLTPQLKIENKKLTLTGNFKHPLYKETLHYSINGPLSHTGNWNTQLYDKFNNRLELQLTKENNQPYIGTWEILFTQLHLKQLGGPPISGKVRGGISCIKDLSKVQFKFDADQLKGSRFKFNDMKIQLDAALEKDLLIINNLTVGENNNWSGKLEFCSIDIAKKIPKKFSLLINQLPLGKFSTKVSGKVDADFTFDWPILKSNVYINELFPEKDILNKVEKYKAELTANNKEFHYKQSFIQAGDQNSLEAKIKVLDLFSNLQNSNKGVLTYLKIKSNLFELKLAKPAQVSVDYLGISASSFQLEDKYLRLNQLKGSAYIPFLKPQTLEIKADHASLDLSKFPTIASSPMSGIITIKSAIWNKGWSLRNLNAKFSGKNLKLFPNAILPQTTISYISGSMGNSSVHIDKLIAAPINGGSLSLKGKYSFYQRFLNLNINASGLNYESDSYNINYNSENLHIHGPINKINTSGNISINGFRYFESFELFGDENNLNSNLKIQLPDAPDIEHTLNLNISNIKPMQLSNSTGQLSFNIETLNLNGAILAPTWNGTILSTTSALNKLSLPIKPIDISFESPKVKLFFSNDTKWNPTLTLHAKTHVKDTQIFLGYDGPLNDFKKGFILNSQPSLSQSEIIDRLSGGVSQQKNVFESNPNENNETSAPKLSITRGISLDKNSTLKPILSSDTGLFEFNFNYSLNDFLELEVTQDLSNNYQLSLRLSKSEDHFNDLFQLNTRIKNKNIKNSIHIDWEISGLNIFDDPFFKKELLIHLKRVDPSLQRSDFKDAREQVKHIITKFLAEKGFLFASIKINSIQQNTKKHSRHTGKRIFLKEAIKVKIQIFPGKRYVINDVVINGWPQHLKKNLHSQINTPHRRSPLFQMKNLKQYQTNLIKQLQNNGYPAAKISSAEIFHRKVSPIPIETNVSKFDLLPPQRREIKSINLTIGINSGEIHNISQILFIGNDSYSKQKLLDIINAKSGDNYVNNVLNKHLNKIIKWYQNNNYFNTNVSVKILRSRYYNRVSLHYIIEEGKKWNIGNILFEGLNRISETYIKDRIPELSGRVANKNEIRNLIRSLSQLTSFISVRHEWVDSNEPHIKDLKIIFEETKTYDFSSRLGLESENGVNASLSFSRHNIFNHPNTLSFEGGLAKHESLRKISFDTQKVLNQLDGQLLIAQRRERISSLDFINSQFILKISLIEKNNNSLLKKLSILFQSDDNFQNSNKSFRLQFSKNFSKYLKGPEEGFDYFIFSSLNEYLTEKYKVAYTGDYKVRYGIKLGKSILSPWFRYAHHLKSDKNFYIPLNDRYFLGGTQSLRGYKNDEISGPIQQGGESLMSLGIQLFYPFNSWVDGSLFYESGNVFNDSYQIHFNKLHNSIGMGLLFRTPVGPIQTFFGRPLDRSHGRFGIQLGTNF